LFTADSKQEIADCTARIAAEALHHPITVVRLLTSDQSALEPVAVTEEARDILGERPTYQVNEGTAGRAFAENDTKVFQDLSTIEDGYDRGEAKSGLFVPMNESGVLAIGEREIDAFEPEDIHLAQILATNAAIALNRLEREQELQRQNERLEDFASVISHDLRNPLNVATGRLEMMETDSPHIDPIENALDRMQTLIDDVLTLARQGRSVNETEPVQLERIVRESWQNVSTEEVQLDVVADTTIQADPGRLPEVFENLFRNAIEHGGHVDTVTVGDLPTGFFVADDGRGIPVENRSSVLDGGFTTSDSGTGFGLSIVREIAEAHGWDISVTESVNGGARFDFTGVVLTDD
jgi:signal transduction histidine kinase